MNREPGHAGPAMTESASPSPDMAIPQLVAQVYETAPPALRGRLLEHLLQPLGVLSLVAVANGIFAKIRFHSGWPDAHVRLEDVRQVQASDVMALADRVQQVNVESLHGLARMLAASPVLSGSAAAALLITLLLKHGRGRRADDL